MALRTLKIVVHCFVGRGTSSRLSWKTLSSSENCVALLRLVVVVASFGVSLHQKMYQQESSGTSLGTQTPSLEMARGPFVPPIRSMH